MKNMFIKTILVVLLMLVIRRHFADSLWLGDCNRPLGLSSGELPDEALTASSSHYPIVGPHRARLGREDGGGAWCPKGMVDRHQREYLEVDLSTSELPYLVTAVGTQGRFANTFGMEYTPGYTIEYAKPGSNNFVPYTRTTNSNESVLLIGNTDTFTEIRNELERPLLANRVRILPYSLHPRVVCLRLELYGCLYTGNLLYYKIEDHPGRYAVGEGVLQDGIVITSYYDDESTLKGSRKGHPLIKKDWEFFIDENIDRLANVEDSSSFNDTDDLELMKNLNEGALSLPSLPPGEVVAPDFPLNASFIFNKKLCLNSIYLYLDPIHPLIAGAQPVLSAMVEFNNLSTFGEKYTNFTFNFTLENLDFTNLSLPLKNVVTESIRICITTDHTEVNVQEVYFEAELWSEKMHEQISTSTDSTDSHYSKYTTPNLIPVNEPVITEKRQHTTTYPPVTTKGVNHFNHVAILKGNHLPIPNSKPKQENSGTVVWTVHTATSHRTYVGVAIGLSVGVGLLLGVWIWLWARTTRGKTGSPRIFRRPPPPDTLDMACLMDGPHNEFSLTTPPYESVIPTVVNEEQGISPQSVDDSLKAPLVPNRSTQTVSTVSSSRNPMYFSAPFTPYSLRSQRLGLSSKRNTQSAKANDILGKKNVAKALYPFQTKPQPQENNRTPFGRWTCSQRTDTNNMSNNSTNNANKIDADKPYPLSYALQNEMFLTH